MKSTITLLFSIIFLSTIHAQVTDLSLKLENGKEYKQTLNLTATINQQLQGQEITMVMKISGTMSFLVKAVNQDGYQFDTKYDKLSMTMQMPQATMEFSSEKKDTNDILSSILGQMIGKTFEVKMSTKGKITEVKNVEALWNAQVDQLDKLTDIQKAQVKQQISKAYGADAFKGNIEMATAIYPDNPVNIGDTWTVSTDLESGFSASVISNYKLDDVTPEYDLINGNSTIQTKDKDAYIESNGMKMRYDLKGTMVSAIKVDKISGWIIEAKINQDIKGDAIIKENPQMPEGMKFAIIMNNEMVITN